jgi:hypothetical protein
MTIDEKTFNDRVKATLNASTNYIDADTQHRLHAIRRQALQSSRQSAWWKTFAWAPVAGVAFCSVMAVMFILPGQQHPANPATATSEYTAMFELMENPEDLDAVSDADFYLWLDEENGNSASPADSQPEHAAQSNIMVIT